VCSGFPKRSCANNNLKRDDDSSARFSASPAQGHKAVIKQSPSIVFQSTISGETKMRYDIDHRRRRFCATAAMTIAAAPLVPLLSAPPASAQAAISEPGAYAFYHPDGDLLGVGARQIRPGAGALTVVPSNALAATPPRATRSHRRAARVAN
jgi:hypothetical protein